MFEIDGQTNERKDTSNTEYSHKTKFAAGIQDDSFNKNLDKNS